MTYSGGVVLDGGDFLDYGTGSSEDGGTFDGGGAPDDGGGFTWDDQTALEKMRAFVSRYPFPDELTGLLIDFTDNVPNSGGLFPSGLVEVSRRKSITGRTTAVNQYNFALYTVLEKSPDDDGGAALNAEWQMAFQEWVQAQSIAGGAPVFGDEPRTERITAQNGALYSAEGEGTAIYAVQLSVTFTRHFD